MELTSGEQLNPLWIKLFTHVKDRLESNRLLLEVALTEKEADKLRGRIAEDKLFLALNDEPPPMTVPNVEM